MVNARVKRIITCIVLLFIAFTLPTASFASDNVEAAGTGIALDTFYSIFAGRTQEANCFTVGDSTERVVQLMGEPDAVLNIPGQKHWRYRNSYVYFNDSDKVITWTNTGNLLVSIGRIDYSYKGFTYKSGYLDVVRAMGTPDTVKYDPNLNQVIFGYGKNTVIFNAEGLVIGWLGDGKLRVYMGEREPDAPPVTVGSTKEDVLRAMGTPTSLYETDSVLFWGYGISNIYFDEEGRVENWSNLGRNLKVTFGDDTTVEGIFGIGSTKDEVLKIMGTPDYMFESLSTSYWRYGNSRVEFDRNGKVRAWHNIDFNLKVDFSVRTFENKYITFDSTKNDVASIMGTPWSIVRSGESEVWGYDLSTIRFVGESIESIYNVNNRLKVGLPSEADPFADPFTLGSTKLEVAKVMGPPDVANDTREGSTWTYGQSTVYFDANQKVSGWSNNGNNLKLKLGPDNPDGYFTIGSDASAVINCMGTPTVIYTGGNETYWKYGISTIYFDKNDRVVSYANWGNNLKVNLGSADETAPPFTLGSGREEVLRAMGTPQVISVAGDKQTWYYGNSTVYFDSRGKVTSWNNYGNLKVSMGKWSEPPSTFTVGSSMEDVIKAMGTPDSIYTNNFSVYATCWRYGWSTVYFDKNGKVLYWDNMGGNLRVVEL